ncbi:hypothetical protein ACRASX_13100 [Flavobacterium sp. TMP13]|uniref:hypothetical protein n=1 Tax=unclassified Flavobacterium TaxID=196869 RepID=UPI00076CDF39|nr:hypothetical protein [Flavobacterium sp. TAB 87]KVV14714.1 hypothetical protein AP058_01767 [Flavobacterium sp. TAB 87]
MKKIVFILLAVTLFVGCKSKKVNEPAAPEVAKIVAIPAAEINRNQQNKAYDLGSRVLLTCNTSKFKAFDATEVTKEVMDNTTIERISKTCSKFRQWYGTFIDLKLDGVYKINGETVYRFRALYTKKVANKELRVTVNENNLVSGIKSLDWDNSFESKLNK